MKTMTQLHKELPQFEAVALIEEERGLEPDFFSLNESAPRAQDNRRSGLGR
jgi:hypothetical protein